MIVVIRSTTRRRNPSRRWTATDSLRSVADHASISPPGLADSASMAVIARA